MAKSKEEQLARWRETQRRAAKKYRDKQRAKQFCKKRSSAGFGKTIKPISSSGKRGHRIARARRQHAKEKPGTCSVRGCNRSIEGGGVWEHLCDRANYPALVYEQANTRWSCGCITIRMDRHANGRKVELVERAAIILNAWGREAFDYYVKQARLHGKVKPEQDKALLKMQGMENGNWN